VFSCHSCIPQQGEKTVSNDVVDQRKHPRVEFFLVPTDKEQLPVWVFKPDTLPDSHAGLILNMSEGGVQLLTSAEDPITGDRFEIQLMPDSGVVEEGFKVLGRRVWSQPLTKLGQLHGFEFDDLSSPASQFLADYGLSVSERKWVRCLLVVQD
jgi:hypothetical protein